MAKYRAFIHGTNFHIWSEDSQSVESLGFYTNAFVEAASPESAESTAVALIRQVPRLRHAVRNPADDRPRIFVEQVEEIADWPADTVRPLTGLAFYDEALERSSDPDQNI